MRFAYSKLVVKFLTVFTLLSWASLSHAQDGKSLFQSNCAQCHSVGKGVVIGPDLKDIEKRRDEAWLIKWIKSSKAVIASGDKYAVDIYNKFNKVEMPNQNVTDVEIKAILAYVKDEANKAPATPVAAAGATSEDQGTNWTLILALASGFLALIALLLMNVIKTLAGVVRQKQGLPEPAKKEFNWEFIKEYIFTHKKQVALTTILLILIGSVKLWYALGTIGIQTGYQPEQPIAFSHKIHAGENKIACLYCHVGADKGKVAGVPSANVCMNCHKYIKEGTQTGTKEISKIYKALDYDPSTGQYGNNPKPLKWVRVHNLPDLAYFNHSQHVKVGKVECQTCHGEVQEMTVAKQVSPLTMGWCIDCHRNTEVQMAENGYYTELHEKLKKKYGAETKLTVDKIGGLECARCHY